MVNNKKFGCHTITVRKGVKDGIDYVNFLVDGDLRENDYSLSRELTGTTGEHSCGIFSNFHPQDIKLFYGLQETSLYAVTKSAKILSCDLSTQEFTDELKLRILSVRKWVQEQDFETEESFTI